MAIKYTTAQLARCKRMGWVSNAGIIWDKKLAGAQGMDFILVPDKHHTKKDIADAKRALKNSRDVVHFFIGECIGDYPS